jgi:hypothetical protein
VVITSTKSREVNKGTRLGTARRKRGAKHICERFG